MTETEVTTWTIVKTDNYKTIDRVLNEAYAYSLLHVLIGYPGAGKSTTLNFFLSNFSNVAYVRLDKTYSKKDFYVALLRCFDEQEYGYDIPVKFLADRLAEIISKTSGKCLIIIDDAGRLSASFMEYFQSIFDRNEGKLGMVLSGTMKFSSDFKRWVTEEKLGIPELASRVHEEEFVYLKRPATAELKFVAKQNGITDNAELISIVKGCNNFRTLRSRVVKHRIDMIKAKIKESK